MPFEALVVRHLIQEKMPPSIQFGRVINATVAVSSQNFSSVMET